MASSGLPMKIGPPRYSCCSTGVSSRNVWRATVWAKAVRSTTPLLISHCVESDGSARSSLKFTLAASGLPAKSTGTSAPGGNHTASSSPNTVVDSLVDSRRTPGITFHASPTGMSVITYSALIRCSPS